jgi:hypothetical protein
VPVLTEQPAGKTGAMPIRPKIPIPITATRLAAITIGQGRMVAVVDLLVVLGSFSYGRGDRNRRYISATGDKMVRAVKAEPTITVAAVLDARARVVKADGLSGYNQATEQSERRSPEIFALRHDHDTTGESHDVAG